MAEENQTMCDASLSEAARIKCKGRQNHYG